MRRPREVGIVMVMLLGLSGCAGMQQQGLGGSPSGATGCRDERPLARLAFWRRPKADSETSPADAGGLPDPGRTVAGDSASSCRCRLSTAQLSVVCRWGTVVEGRATTIPTRAHPAWKFGSPRRRVAVFTPRRPVRRPPRPRARMPNLVFVRRDPASTRRPGSTPEPEPLRDSSTCRARSRNMIRRQSRRPIPARRRMPRRPPVPPAGPVAVPVLAGIPYPRMPTGARLPTESVRFSPRRPRRRDTRSTARLRAASRRRRTSRASAGTTGPFGRPRPARGRPR